MRLDRPAGLVVGLPQGRVPERLELGPPPVALRLEGRWRVTDTQITTSSGVYCDYYGYCYYYASDWYNSGEFTAGLTYKLPMR
mgnify:CR=1 FL=1